MTINECIEKYVYKEKIKSEELKKFCSEIILCDDFIYKNIIKSLRFASIFSNANGYVDKQCNIFLNIKKTMRTNNKTHLRLFHLFTALLHECTHIFNEKSSGNVSNFYELLICMETIIDKYTLHKFYKTAPNNHFKKYYFSSQSELICIKSSLEISLRTFNNYLSDQEKKAYKDFLSDVKVSICYFEVSYLNHNQPICSFVYYYECIKAISAKKKKFMASITHNIIDLLNCVNNTEVLEKYILDNNDIIKDILFHFFLYGGPIKPELMKNKLILECLSEKSNSYLERYTIFLRNFRIENFHLPPDIYFDNRKLIINNIKRLRKLMENNNIQINSKQIIIV